MNLRLVLSSASSGFISTKRAKFISENNSGYFEMYEADLERHAGRFNGLYGAAIAAKKAGQTEKAAMYFKQLKAAAQGSEPLAVLFSLASVVFLHLRRGQSLDECLQSSPRLLERGRSDL